MDNSGPAMRQNHFFWASPQPPTAPDACGPFSSKAYAAQRYAAGPQPAGTAPAALREAIGVQAETIAAIDRTERNMNEAERLGELAKAQLQEDNIIIEVVDGSMNRNESVLKAMKRSMRRLFVQLIKDRLFICLFAIGTVLVVAAIIVKIYFSFKSRERNTVR